MKWKNIYLDNCSYFITSTVNGRIPILTEPDIADIFLKNLNKAREVLGFKLFAYVIMPDHWHLLCYFGKGSKCLAFNRDFKRFSSTEIIRHLRDESRFDCLNIFQQYANGKAKFSFWKDQARAFMLFDPDKVRQKFEYIHLNPVRAGLADHPEDYKYSSASYYLKKERGLIDIDEISFYL